METPHVNFCKTLVNKTRTMQNNFGPSDAPLGLGVGPNGRVMCMGSQCGACGLLQSNPYAPMLVIKGPTLVLGNDDADGFATHGGVFDEPSSPSSPQSR
jgi:hypothetical protein